MEVMRYLKLFENFKDIDSLCEKYKIENYIINSDGTVDVNGDVALYSKILKSLPIKFGRVGGWFNCSYNQLTSLEGCPKEVVGDFYCFSNKLTIIDYLPEWIEGDIDLGNNEIRDIKVEDKNYMFYGKCHLEGNPINDLFKYWEGNLKNFIIELEFEDFIRDDGESLDITRFEYALNGKEYNREDITNYKLIYKINF